VKHMSAAAQTSTFGVEAAADLFDLDAALPAE
jgi:hypothetical protein